MNESAKPKVSILMLTHDAPKYVEIAISSVAKYTKNVDYELVVVDNASQLATQRLLRKFSEQGLVSRVSYLSYNSLFAEGNNIAAQMASPDCTHFLLLNSDVEVKNPLWLKRLVDVHDPGITAYGVCENPLRVDGYSLLIDKDLYLRHSLDQNHQWYWAVTKLQAAILSEGYSVRGFAEHEKYLHHFGGKSGSDFKSAAGLVVQHDEIIRWFNDKSIYVVDALKDGSLPHHRRSILKRGFAKLHRILP